MSQNISILWVFESDAHIGEGDLRWVLDSIFELFQDENPLFCRLCGR